MGLLDWFSGSNPAASVAQGAASGILEGIDKAANGIREAITGKLDADGQAKFDLAWQAMTQKLQEGQQAINLADAQSGSNFRGGWRPACGWCGVMGLAYQFFIQPILVWGCLNFGWVSPPAIDGSVLMNLLMALLGLGTMRTVERVQGVAKG
jgi:hypothetical protein